MKELTTRQQEVLDYIDSFIQKNNFSPSVRDITGHFGLASAAGAHKHIKALVSKGFLLKDAYLSRSVRLTRPSKSRKSPPEQNSMEVPLRGLVAAGQPIEAIAQHETITIPNQIGRRGANLFALKVQGDSMIEEGIWDGDFVILESRESAENGETVVALINGEEATLKRWYRENGHVRLQPANVNMHPIIIDRGSVTVQGVVVGLWRNYRGN